MAYVVTNQDFLKSIDELNLKNKSVTWNHITEALSSKDIIVKSEPIDEKSLALWKKEKNKIEVRVKRIRKLRINQKKNNSDYYVEGVFLDPSDFENLFYVESSSDNNSNDQDWEDICDENEDTSDKNELNDNQTKLKKKSGPSKLHIKKLSNYQQKERTRPIYEELLKFIKAENVSMSWLVSFLARRFYSTYGEHFDYSLSCMFDKIVKGIDPFKHKSVPSDKAIYLKSMLKAGRRKCTINKKILAPYCNFPGSDAIRIRENELHPKVLPSINEGVKFDMSEVISMHVQGILEDLVIPPLQTLPPHISVEIYFGFDGSGNHHEFRSVKTDSENLILVGLRVAFIRNMMYDNSESDIIFEEKSQADYTEIPLRVIPGKETDCLVDQLWTELELEVENCNLSEYPITVNGQKTVIHPRIEFTQADR